MRTHLNLATVDLAKSVKFYSTLLDTEPTKVLGNYALFITDQPGLELALDLTNEVSPTRDEHYGVYVESAEDVERAITRLERASLASSIEREETCCYANQTKVRTIDPASAISAPRFITRTRCRLFQAEDSQQILEVH